MGEPKATEIPKCQMAVCEDNQTARLKANKESNVLLPGKREAVNSTGEGYVPTEAQNGVWEGQPFSKKEPKEAYLYTTVSSLQKHLGEDKTVLVRIFSPGCPWC